MKLLEGLTVNKSPYDKTPLHKEYTTILKLAHRLQDENIPYDLHRRFEGWQICFKNGGRNADIIEFDASYGYERNLMESYGFDEDDGDVTGYLDVEEAMKMIYNFYGITENHD